MLPPDTVPAIKAAKGRRGIGAKKCASRDAQSHFSIVKRQVGGIHVSGSSIGRISKSDVTLPAVMLIASSLEAARTPVRLI